VLGELTALLVSPLRVPKPTRAVILNEIRSDPDIEVVEVTPDLEAAAWHLWRTYLDKDWSLVDCASFVVMDRLKLTDAVTADHHFDQAGFARLLR
jgi:predicted nucleic acid-binding protein